MTRNAARMTDTDACPAHGPKPLGPPTSPDVLADFEASARFGDRPACPGLDAVLSGAATVLVNGLPAARLGDITAHLGALVTGTSRVLVDAATVVGQQMKDNDGKLTNTFVAHDRERGRLFIVSHIQYSGADTSEAFASSARKDIEAMWSGQYDIRGKSTEVTVKVNALSSTEAQSGYDQVNVDSALKRANQRLGGGAGNQHPVDDLADGDHHVPAHEYGHTLGIEDQYMDVPGKASVADPSKTTNTADNIMVQTWKDSGTGNQPHPYSEHYEEMLRRMGR
ncbi:MAG: hypothetical protein EXR75_06050 [Myxococcales bacterium]|nr:hypothetical protein [Myxococcales bacterium]